ncbi:MAG TPA: hypothetical protein VFR84_13730 [Candidatus Angelobacter sp.]|nr:hypothetical protein [Candidatus Angelobacter sp.]
MKKQVAILICVVALAGFLARAQKGAKKSAKASPTPATTVPQNAPPQNPVVPTITYDRVWEAYTPQNISITVQSTGTTKYLSRNPAKPREEQETDPDFTLEFTMSAGNREKLFRDAKEANYFEGDFAFKKHVVSSTGKKTLTYADPARHFETVYDYSESRAIAEITNIFQGISNTIEHGRKLQYLRRFDKLGLEDELRGMEAMAENNYLAELQLIAPTLENIANDPAILNIARQRARRLLARSSSEQAASESQK